MITAPFLLDQMLSAGFSVFTGVPCSYLTPVINVVIASPQARYLPAVNEGDAVAIGSGAKLGGRDAVVMFQNSGLGNAVNPLTSLNAVFRVPVLLITTWRGEPGGAADEPQHQLMGEITPSLLDLMEIPWELFPRESRDWPALLARARATMERDGRPFGLIMQQGSVAPFDLPADQDSFSPRHGTPPRGPLDSVPLDPDDVLGAIQAAAEPNDILIATTGHTGRALYALADRPNQLYMVGSMGCATSLGLGLAIAQPQRRVIVLDGDGAFLMRMGALAAIGRERPANLVHVLLDNGIHESTGGQATVSTAIDPAAVAAACGYQDAVRVRCHDELQATLRAASQLTFLHVRTRRRTDRKLPRPAMTPADVADRLQTWLQSI